MNNHTSEAYDRLWTHVAGNVSPQETSRIAETMKAIPSDCTSVLDVGCGDGRITNLLHNADRTVTGLDSSLEGLRYVTSHRVAGRVDALPFPDGSFDLALCTELLEHLPFTTYPKALAELARVAGKYILVTVPNTQDLAGGMVPCPQCGCRFHPDRHVRAFAPQDMGELFPGFTTRAVRTIIPARMYGRTVLRMARRIVEPRGYFPPTAVCPQCGYASASTGLYLNVGNQRRRVMTRLAHFVGPLIPSHRQGVWLLALYARVRK